MQLALSTLANTHTACTLQRMGIHYLITTSAVADAAIPITTFAVDHRMIWSAPTTEHHR
jgi:hypothetical protein